MGSSATFLLDRDEFELELVRWRARLAEYVPGFAMSPAIMRIHPNDQMFTHSLEHHRDLGAALSQYFAISLQRFSVVRQLLDALYGDQVRRLRVLDFACGYGRLLRFLGAVVPSRQTWASDIQVDAVAYVAETFGVHGIVSHADPTRFDPKQRFDVIWVASLFSHLPEPLFHAWLARLLDLLAPEGVLCFSVRDASQLPADVKMPAAGFLYATQSENAELDSAIYGTAYASESFVRDALVRIAPDMPCVRLPRALANEQDLYVVAREKDRDLSVVPEVRRGPWGWVDIRRLGRNGAIDVQGWAASLDDGDVQRVQLTLDGTRVDVRTGIARSDVAAALDDSRLAHSGWSHQCAVPEVTASVVLQVEALSERGEHALLYAGTLTAQ